MLVKEVEPDEFAIWFGTNDMPASIEFTATDAELAAHGLYRPLPEETIGPTPFHRPSGVTFERVYGLVRAFATFTLTDLPAAKSIAGVLLAQQKAQHLSNAYSSWSYMGPDDDITALFDARALEHEAAIAAAATVEALMALDFTDAAAWPTEDALPT